MQESSVLCLRRHRLRMLSCVDIMYSLFVELYLACFMLLIVSLLLFVPLICLYRFYQRKPPQLLIYYKFQVDLSSQFNCSPYLQFLTDCINY